MMRLATSVLVFLLATLCIFTPRVEATALTYKIAAQENACFYLYADSPGKKIGFYFAVQSGGSFDIDYKVSTPQSRIIMKGEREHQGDFVFTATEVGEYSFCFSNDMSTFVEKLVDLEVILENDARPVFEKDGAATPPLTLSSMEEALYRVSDQLTNVARMQKYFRTRENRHMSTVLSTESRVFWFAFLESTAIIVLAVLQVFVVQNFFSVKRGGV